MSRPWLERLTERANPIVVKEVRQGLRTRAFWIFFGLMLLSCLVISLVAFAVQAQSDSEPSGPATFAAYFVCLGLVQFLVIPYTAYRSLAREREDETWALLTLTGLGPRRILFGKLGSFVAQAALYGSAAGPFLVFSYYLNGIDLPTIGVVLVLGAAFQVFLSSVAVCAATLAEQRVTRGLVHFGLLGLLLLATLYGLVAAVAVVSEGRSVLNEREFPVVAAFGLWAMLSYGVLLFEAAASRLALPTENRAWGVRLAFLAQCVVTAGAVAVFWVLDGKDPRVAVVAQAVFCVHLAVAGVFLATDADGMPNRLRKGARFYSLFRPGASRAFRLVMATLVASTALWGALYLSADRSVDDHRFLTMVAAGAYLALYLSAALLISRLAPGTALRTPAGARLTFIALVAVGAGLPPLVGALALKDASANGLNLFNPVVGIDNFNDRHVSSDALLVLASAAVVATLVADRVLAWRDGLALAGARK